MRAVQGPYMPSWTRWPRAKTGSCRLQMLSQLNEAQELAESDVGDYARALADYEDHLARGEIRW